MKAIGRFSLAVAALAAIPLAAQDQGKMEKAGLVRLGDLAGKEVRLKDGQEYGSVKDVVVDLQRGRAAFAAVARKEDASRIVAIPVNKFRPLRTADGKKLEALMIDDAKAVADAPGATLDEWNKTEDQALLARLAGKSEGAESLVRAQAVKKASVVDAGGERIGEVDEVMVNLENSRLLALVGVGGVLGIGERRHVVPWEILRVREVKKDGSASFTLSVPRDRLEKGPVLGKDEENRLSDPAWVAGLYEHYQYGPLGGERDSCRCVLADRLIGVDVAMAGKPDEEIGSIEGLAVVPASGKIAYVALDVDGKLYAVPLHAFKVTHDKKDLKVALDADKAMFKGMRPFDADHWPERADAWKGVKADADGAAAVPLRSSDVLDADVKDSRRVTFGEIEDFALDLDSGHLLYVIVGSGGFLGIGETMYGIPWKAMKWAGDKERFFSVSADRKTLERSVEFDEKRYSDPGYIRSIYAVYGLEFEPRKLGEPDAARKTQP